jgi:hypothetical protein
MAMPRAIAVSRGESHAQAPEASQALGIAVPDVLAGADPVPEFSVFALTRIG